MSLLKPSKIFYLTLAITTMLTSACTHTQTTKILQKPNMESIGSAKNIILFVGDGMGVSTVTAIRILDGQKKGNPGEENVLSWETFPNVALAKTYNTNQQVADSAGTATAMMTGQKTKAGFISVTENQKRGSCVTGKSFALPTLLEIFEKNGRSTGVVTTARLTHATPAATYAHVSERDWESDADMSAAIKNNGCTDIASQLLNFPVGDGLEVAMGGGRSNFISTSMRDPEDVAETGKRLDGRDLTQEWSSRPNSQYVWNKSQFDQIDTSQTDHLLGLFERGHMEFELHRANDTGGEPSLSEMMNKALDILEKNPNGYFLMVEAGRIDHGHHKGTAALALNDGVELAKAVALADQRTADDDTLIIVTADHSHVFTIAGYPTRGNPILGKVIGNDRYGDPKNTPDLGDDGLPYTTVGYLNGPGAVKSYPRPDLSHVNTEADNFQQQALMPRSSETHAGEDVAIYAKGPGAKNVRGVMEQNEIFNVMLNASKLVLDND